MMLYELRDNIPSRLKRHVGNIGILLFVIMFAFSTGLLAYHGYVKDGEFTELFNFIPIYLLLFYALGGLITILAFYVTNRSRYDSLLLGFLVAYVASFYWEIPENIFWQLKRGYHPALLLVLLGVFPYIWLDKRLGWKRSRGNILLVLLGWASTTFGVLITPSNIYTTSFGVLYFLFCRVLCLLVLVKVFILDKGSKSIFEKEGGG